MTDRRSAKTLKALVDNVSALTAVVVVAAAAAVNLRFVKSWRAARRHHLASHAVP